MLKSHRRSVRMKTKGASSAHQSLGDLTPTASPGLLPTTLSNPSPRHTLRHTPPALNPDCAPQSLNLQSSISVYALFFLPETSFPPPVSNWQIPPSSSRPCLLQTLAVPSLSSFMPRTRPFHLQTSNSTEGRCATSTKQISYENNS